MHNRSGGGGGEKNLSAAFRGIGAICDRLGLVRIIRDRACELFKQVGVKFSNGDFGQFLCMLSRES